MGYNFDSILGEEQLIRQMKAVAKSGRNSHAYLITGERRSGKSTLAHCFAKALQCESDGDKPCNGCLSCMQMDAKDHPDVITLFDDDEDTIKVDDVRRLLNDDIYIKPYRSERKVYILENIERMTATSQNSLLKTLEEPPSYGIIIMTCSSADALLSTILSRTVVLPVRPVPDAVIRQYLTRTEHIPDYKADSCIAFARGNLGKAVEFVHFGTFEKEKEEAVTFLKSLDDTDRGELYVKVLELTQNRKTAKEKKEEKARKKKAAKEEAALSGSGNGEIVKKELREESVLGDNKLEILMDFILIWYRDALYYKSTGSEQGLIFREEIQYIKKVSKEVSYRGFEEVFQALADAKDMLMRNINPETVADLLLLTLKNCKKEE